MNMRINRIERSTIERSDARNFMCVDETRRSITTLLNDIRQGDKTAEGKVFPILYDELHRHAVRYMRSERADHTLQPTALVHEAYLRIFEGEAPEWQSRAHFMAVAAQVMRRILVDHARQRHAAKRGGAPVRMDLLDSLAISDDGHEMLALDEALSRLEEWDARQSRVVELRFFAGMTDEESALVLGVSTRTVKRDWSSAKAWLYSEMTKR